MPRNLGESLRFGDVIPFERHRDLPDVRRLVRHYTGSAVGHGRLRVAWQKWMGRGREASALGLNWVMSWEVRIDVLALLLGLLAEVGGLIGRRAFGS